MDTEIKTPYGVKQKMVYIGNKCLDISGRDRGTQSLLGLQEWPLEQAFKVPAKESCHLSYQGGGE